MNDYTTIAFILACPLAGLLFLVTILSPSWRWVFSFILLTGTGLLWWRMSYSLFSNPVLAREWSGLLLHSFILASVGYAGALVWYFARRSEVEVAPDEPPTPKGG